MVALLRQHFFTLASLSLAGCAQPPAEARTPAVAVAEAPSPGPSAARPTSPPRPPCLPAALREHGRIDALAVEADGAVTFCLRDDAELRLCLTARDGRFRRADVELAPAVTRATGEAERLRDVGRRRAWRRCESDEACRVTLDDGERAPATLARTFARTPSIHVEVAGDRVALLDASGALTFLSAESLQPGGGGHVPRASRGAIALVAPGRALVVGGAPDAGTVTRVDLVAASVGEAWSPPDCPGQASRGPTNRARSLVSSAVE